jgi:hypothetical protein
MAECLTSDILEQKMKNEELVRIQISSGSTYDGTISNVDCMGILFIPSDKTLDPSYILYPDIKKFMLPEHQTTKRQ